MSLGAMGAAIAASHLSCAQSDSRVVVAPSSDEVEDIKLALKAAGDATPVVVVQPAENYKLGFEIVNKGLGIRDIFAPPVPKQRAARYDPSAFQRRIPKNKRFKKL
jgi:hypothetical protein